MTSTTVRIRQETGETLRELTALTGKSVRDVLAAAVDAYWREQLLERTNVAYAALRASPEDWRKEVDERALWEGTLADRLESQ